MWVQSLGQEDPLKEGVAIHSIILAWRIPWTEQSGGLQSIGSQSNSTSAAIPDTIAVKEQIHSSLGQWYAVIDLVNAFFTIPIEQLWNWFVFMGKGDNTCSAAFHKVVYISLLFVTSLLLNIQITYKCPMMYKYLIILMIWYKGQQRK